MVQGITRWDIMQLESSWHASLVSFLPLGQEAMTKGTVQHHGPDRELQSAIPVARVNLSQESHSQV